MKLAQHVRGVRLVRCEQVLQFSFAQDVCRKKYLLVVALVKSPVASFLKKFENGLMDEFELHFSQLLHIKYACKHHTYDISSAEDE